MQRSAAASNHTVNPFLNTIINSTLLVVTGGEHRATPALRPDFFSLDFLFTPSATALVQRLIAWKLTFHRGSPAIQQTEEGG
ncbi:hypothetical protein BaRGS_00020453 [Batillaria attramentaria]|uniref:Uncharacterized protein n=1 Tax=Batillaria attramentaria TaxID=370345 RepID=A0ABD0KM69_9CAEN